MLSDVEAALAEALQHAQGRRPLLLDLLSQARHAQAERMTGADLAAPTVSAAVMRETTKPKKAA